MLAKLGKITIGLATVAIVSAATAMSASAQQKPAQQKKVRATIPKEVCEIVTVGTQKWGRQSVQMCGPPGGPRAEATIRPRRLGRLFRPWAVRRY